VISVGAYVAKAQLCRQCVLLCFDVVVDRMLHANKNVRFTILIKQAIDYLV